jgi:putative phosphoribosyl transferase
MHPFFKNRDHATSLLLPYLDKYKNGNGVVMAIPRGGVPIAHHVAKHLNLPLELLMTKKIGHPAHKEFAIGAVSLEDHILDQYQNIPSAYIDQEISRIRESLKQRYKMFMGNHRPADLKNRIVIIIDDGVATGNTILSSISMIRKKEPEKIVVAVPVAPKETVERIKRAVDDLICVYMPEPFIGVGMHYQDFSEVSDEEVIRLLKEINHVGDAA